LYSFRDLVSLRVVRGLLDNGLSLQRIRRAWSYLRRHGDIDTELSEVRLVTDGTTVFHVVDSDGEILDALRNGQLAFFARIEDVTREVAEDISRFELDRERFLEILKRVEDDVLGEAADG
jgi:DNA-binding transcriptional MerR regulator